MSTVAGGALAPTPDLPAIEARWRDRWERSGIHRWDPSGSGPVFSVDTPPPYVSASHLHVGHAMSYAQAEFVVRYQRMRGARVFYPVGFDDNGLPTERFVERKHRIDKSATSRAELRALCLAETAKVATVYEGLWRALGLSLDWSLRYSTIDDHCRRTAQLAFLELFRAGRIHRTDDPVFWDPVLGSALAQADLETVERKAWLHDVVFRAESDEDLVIATTRPELLPACVALYRHPDDDRYRHLEGATATTPLFGHEVPVLADTEVDPGFGTGLMMVCTFGDAEDVRRWRTDGLPTRVCLDDHGRLTDLAGPYAGLDVGAARARIVADLEANGALLGRRRTPQRVATSERTGAPIELIMRPQWFLRILDLVDDLRDRGRALDWHPAWMHQRLDDWITGLRHDWNLSRQRYYGVPFPLWLCQGCGEPTLATPDQLPIDPLDTAPPGPCAACGGALEGDPDVMDTWMTSSLTPQIVTNWAGTPDRPHLDALPLTLRVQAHDIIRTWLFYTLVQAHLHADSVPWERVMISGWGLDEQGRRISKRDLDPNDPASSSRYDPHAVIARHGADALRHWAARGSLGHDVRYSEKDVRAGRKHVIKLWNVARFCAPHLEPGATAPSWASSPVEDRWVLHQLNDAIATATAAFDELDYATARQAADDLLWAVADDWLELTKARIWYPDRHPPASVRSAGTTMGLVVRRLLGLYAPFLPFVTEELHQHLYAAVEGTRSLHVTAWPTPVEGIAAHDGMDIVLAVLRAARGLRTDRGLHHSAEVDTLTLATDDPQLRAQMSALEPSLLAAARAQALATGPASHPTELSDLRVDLGTPADG